MNKMKRRLILCGIVSMFALVNVVVTISNERQKALLFADNTDALSDSDDFLENLVAEFWAFIGNNNNVVYKYNERTNLPCAPVKIFSGRYQSGSSQAQNLDLNLGLTGSANYATGSVNGHAEASYRASKESSTNYQYEYTVDIVLSGNNWKLKTCEPCAESDPDKVGKNCTNYNECADAVNSSASAYRSALGIS